MAISESPRARRRIKVPNGAPNGHSANSVQSPEQTALTERDYITQKINPAIVVQAAALIERIQNMKTGSRNPFHHNEGKQKVIERIRSIVPEGDDIAASALVELVQEILTRSYEFRTKDDPSRPASSEIATHVKLAHAKAAVKQLRSIENRGEKFEHTEAERRLKFVVEKVKRASEDLHLKVYKLDEKGGVSRILHNNISKEAVGALLEDSEIKLEDIATFTQLFQDAEASLEWIPDLNPKNRESIKAFRILVEYAARAIHYLPDLTKVAKVEGPQSGGGIFIKDSMRRHFHSIIGDIVKAGQKE